MVSVSLLEDGAAPVAADPAGCVPVAAAGALVAAAAAAAAPVVGFGAAAGALVGCAAPPDAAGAPPPALLPHAVTIAANINRPTARANVLTDNDIDIDLL